MPWQLSPVAVWRTLTGRPRWVSLPTPHLWCMLGWESMFVCLSVCLCVQVALASDRVGSVQEPLVVLQLMVLEGGGVRKPHLVELNKAELDTLINSLESCSKVGWWGERCWCVCLG